LFSSATQKKLPNSLIACYTEKRRNGYIGMAKSTELINTIAEAVAVVPSATVLLHDRALMDQGIRTKGKRGRGAADMTARDAANLLISVLASPIAGPNVKGSV